MSAPFAAMAAAVDIVPAGQDLLEARDRDTGELLGTARRLVEDGDQIGWYVHVGAHRERVATWATARFNLLNAASTLAGVR